MILYFHKGITNYMFPCKNKPYNNNPCPILLTSFMLRFLSRLLYLLQYYKKHVQCEKDKHVQCEKDKQTKRNYSYRSILYS